MKKFNLKLHTSFLFTLLLFQGCMPDSLTKFKKDAPVKPTSTTSTPVVDSGGTPVTFDHPTRAYYGSLDAVFNFEVTTPVTAMTELQGDIDGSLAQRGNPFVISCSLDQTGNDQTKSLPAGMVLSNTTCGFSGAPSSVKSVVTPFCSDPAYTDQTTCESSTMTWNGTSCTSNKDFAYQTQSACQSSFNKWYPKGSQVPYRVKLTYKNASGTIFTLYSTARIGTYSRLRTILYSQADKLSIVTDRSVSGMTTARTTTLSTGSYTPSSIVSSNIGVNGAVNFLDSSTNVISMKKFIKMTLSDASSFAINGFISTSGNVKIGKIFKKSSDNQNIIYVENISSDEAYFAKDDVIGNSSNFATKTATATIISIDETQIVQRGNALDNDLQFYSSKMIVNFVTNSYIANSTNNIKPLKPTVPIVTNNGTVFTISPKLPDGLTLNSETGDITGKIKKVISPAIAYTITAQNPLGTTTSTLGITAIDAPKDFSLTTQQILTVSNTAFFTEGETLFQKLNPPLSAAPQGRILKILNGYQIAVEASNGSFTEGESLDSGSGFFSEKAYILAKDSCTNSDYDSKDDCEDPTNGTNIWSQGIMNYNLALKLDSATTYYSPRCSNAALTSQTTCEQLVNGIWDESTAGVCEDPTKVTKPTCLAAGKKWTYCSNTTFLTRATCEAPVNTWTEPGTCTDTNYKSQSRCEENEETWSSASYVTTATARAVLVKAFNTTNECSNPAYNNSATCIANAGTWAPRTVLFVQHLTDPATSVASAKVFSEGDDLSGSLRKINEIDSANMKLTLNDATNFKVGLDVTSQNPTSLKVTSGGYTYAKSGNTIFVGDKTRAYNSPWFRKNDDLYPKEQAIGAIKTKINAVSHDVLIVAERGQYIYLNPATSTTSRPIFTITPTLPAGLTLNTRTGVISGRPTTMTPRREYILTMTNFVAQYSFVFALEVRDYFTLTDSSGAPSFILHKIGDTQASRKCRINASDIINQAPGTLLDIRCHLEGQEEDLYFNPIKLKASSGPGVCQYVQYSPYWFWQYSPGQSNGTSSLYAGTTVKSGCVNSGTVPTADLCESNYARNNGQGPNCDEGKLTYTAESWADTGGGCALQASNSVNVPCGGKKINCMTGPIKDLLSDDALSGGFRTVIYQTPNGANQDWTLSSPIGKGDHGNMRVVNSMKNNACTTSLADINTWTTEAAKKASTVQPFGSASPYYTFNCMNAASQITGRIRLIVRDWDRDFKINNGLDLDDPSTTTTGVASDAKGTFMNNATKDDYDYPFNNHNDWDNDYTNAGSCDDGVTASEYWCVSYGGTWTSAGGSYDTCGVKGTGREFKFPGSNL